MTGGRDLRPRNQLELFALETTGGQQRLQRLTVIR
jgi:hypothetical protein